MDCPAGVVPVTKVTLQDIKELDDYQGHYNDPWDENVKQVWMYCKISSYNSSSIILMKMDDEVVVLIHEQKVVRNSCNSN